MSLGGAMRKILLLMVVTGLSACGSLPEVPQVEEGLAQSGTYPEFVPIRDVIFEQRAAQDRALETEEQLEARVAGLRTRAAQLRTAQTQ